MIKKTLAIVSIGMYCFAQAQDISTIRNVVDVYAKGTDIGTAKYTAMAGAMGALGGDVSAAVANPAGMGVYITGDFTATLSFGDYTNASTIFKNVVRSKNNFSNLSQVSGVASFSFEGSKWKFVNVGVNYVKQNLDDYAESRASGRVINRTLYDSSNRLVNGIFVHQGHVYDRTADASKTSFLVGANYDNKLYFGAGINLSDASVEQYDTQRFILDLDGKFYDFNKRFTPFSEKSSGYSVSAGLIAKVDKNFRVGLSLESPTWWYMERVFRGQDLDADQNVKADTYSEDRSFSTPMKSTISLAFVPNKHFAFNVDYTLGLTRPHYKVQGDAEVELNQFFKNEEYNKHFSELKAGGEFRFNGFRARAGYSYASNPFYGKNFIGAKNSFAAGLGYDFKGLYIDATYRYTTSSYTNDFGKGDYFTNSILLTDNDFSSSRIMNKRNHFILGIGYRF